MRTGIAPATDNAGVIAIPHWPPPDRQQSRQREAGGFGHPVIETVLVAGERLVDYP